MTPSLVQPVSRRLAVRMNYVSTSAGFSPALGQNTHMKKPNRRRGFSLIELMVALGVIAVSLFSIITMITHTATEKESQRQLAIAKEAVEKKIDELKGQAWTNLQSGSTAYNAFTVEGLAYPLTADKKGQGTCTPTFTPAVGTTTLVDVEVRVEWQGVFGGQHKDSLTTTYVQKWNSYAVRTMLTR